MYFLVRFPHEYDPDLFKYSSIAESSQLVGYLNADVLSRQVKIYGMISLSIVLTDFRILGYGCDRAYCSQVMGNSQSE